MPTTDNPIARDLRFQARRHPTLIEDYMEGWFRRHRGIPRRPILNNPLICPTTGLRRGYCSCAVCMPALKRIQAAVEKATVDLVIDRMQGEREQGEQGQIVCLVTGEGRD